MAEPEARGVLADLVAEREVVRFLAAAVGHRRGERVAAQDGRLVGRGGRLAQDDFVIGAEARAGGSGRRLAVGAASSGGEQSDAQNEDCMCQTTSA
ncbi:MAG: hypothetical protein BRD44_01735 [Bacteroidetes bacterium QS_7_67_15]|nr:MAG: hypothetical protein BRD44_01735 [Bacteroidetes bacterium QS_7_67_15]